MTEKEMQEASAKKIRQVRELMKLLDLEIEARQHVNKQGFIELVPFWIDTEEYPQPQPIIHTGATGSSEETGSASPTGPTGEQGDHV